MLLAMPPCLPLQVVSLPGKVHDPPPRKVVVERMPQLPPKPQPVLIEKWLPYEKQKRRVIYQPPSFVAGPPEKPKNVIVQWHMPNSIVKKNVRYLGVENADPKEYQAKYGSSLKETNELPKFVGEFDCAAKFINTTTTTTSESKLIPSDLIFDAGNARFNQAGGDFVELVGDLEALNLIDLDKEGLGFYRNFAK
jgi:hypothetical protein